MSDKHNYNFTKLGYVDFNFAALLLLFLFLSASCSSIEPGKVWPIWAMQPVLVASVFTNNQREHPTLNGAKVVAIGRE